MVEMSREEAEKFEKIKKRRVGGIFRLRRGQSPGARDAIVGEVDPSDPFAAIGAAETQGVILHGDDEDKSGIGIFPLPSGKGEKGKKP